MKYRKIFLGLVISLIVIAVLLAVADRKTHAAGGEMDVAVAEQLDQIAQDQKTILEELAAIKQELYIIKIRVTQQQ